MFDCNKKLIERIVKLEKAMEEELAAFDFVTQTARNEVAELGRRVLELAKVCEQARPQDVDTPSPFPKVFLEAGHGWSIKRGDVIYDPGASGQGFAEHVLTTEIVNQTAEILKKEYNITAVCETYIKRTSAKTLTERGTIDSKFGCAVSVHLNAYDNKAEYTTALVSEHDHNIRDVALGDAISYNVATRICNKDQGTQTEWGTYSVPRAFHNSGVPGCIIECFFIDSPGELGSRKLETIRKCAQGIAQGISVFLNS